MPRSAVVALCMLALPVGLSAQAHVVPLTRRAETYPAASPDGRFVLYSSDAQGGLDLYLMDVETNAVTRLTSTDDEDSAGSWAPDGRTIVFQREDSRGMRDIWTIERDGTRPRNLTNTPDSNEQHPRFSADGSRIVFDSDRADPARTDSSRVVNYEIFEMLLADGSITRLTTWDLWDMYASFSPDMSRIAWRRAIPGPATGEQDFEIFVKDLTTGHESNLTNDPASDSSPHWSPSGEWIVFISNRAGSSDIYIVRPDGSDLTRLASGARGVLGFARPSFTRDGTRILANRVISGATDIIAIEVPLPPPGND